MSADPFSPVQIGPITIKNRFIRSGANETKNKQMNPTKALLNFHQAYAENELGLTTLAYIAVSKDGRTLPSQGTMSDESVPHYRAITDAIHAAGGKASAQITHGGSFCQIKDLSTPRAMSSSGGIDKMGLLMGRPFQRAMTRADMDMVRDEFAAAALRCEQAGFDAIELHMGHGYLLNQFISPLSNFRRDEYGGSAENRARFPAEVLAAVKQAVGDRLAVIAKINLVDGVKKGATIEDTIVTARALEAAGCDMLVLSAGRNIESTWKMFGSALPYDEMATLQRTWAGKLQFAILKMSVPKIPPFRQNYLMEDALTLKAALGPNRKVKLCYLGGVQSLTAAKAALGEGFDAVAIARALIHDPTLVSQWKAGTADKSGCTACNRCVVVMYGPSGTYCPEVGNAIDPKLNQIYAGERDHAA
ncbi:2,4-dienoyl-CoA reductase [Sphingomonas laterariae]|uniref:2,4-dienoyl-CoA reductase n=1 Tax=Edaphosphingomonas laterariae TaxID=861865 RepID=A0A239D1B6_9SPHN|nr:NADH:flavin oxidoreductase [Sphingomonas laterariae]SNS26225.1 2,4-dienoyl-CoA reductase [Sphingomonas laterariae]